MMKKGRKSFGGLQFRFISILGGILAVLFIVSGIVTSNYCAKVFDVNEENLLQQTNIGTVSEISNYFGKYSTMMQQLSIDPTLKKIMKDLNTGDKIRESEYYSETVQLLKASMDFDSENILAVYFGDMDSKQSLDGNGESASDNPSYDVTARGWFVGAQQQPIYISEPYLDVTSNEQVISIAVAVKDEASNTLGVVSVDLLITTVANMVGETTLGETGFYIMISNEGVVLSHKDKDKLLQNATEIGLDDNLSKSLSEEKTDIRDVKIEDSDYMGAVITIPEVNWKLIGVIPDEEYHGNTNGAVNRIILMYIISGVVMLLALILVARTTVKPIIKLTEATNRMAQGELDVELSINDNSEIGTLAESLKQLIFRLKENIAYIDEVSHALAKLAAGNFRISLEQKYDGEFALLKSSLTSVSETFQQVMSEIVSTSNQITNGASQVANGAQTLAQGATNETTLISEATETMRKMSSDLEVSAGDAKEINNFFTNVASEVLSCNSSMNQMLEAMNEIQKTSNEIGKVIKVIEDIAFQTNILALNAAVEAARAGSAGKGFAVVADEVRNLASKSAEAAQTTTQLIGNSIGKVNDGKSLTDTIAQSLNEITGQTEKVAKLIDGISEAIGLESESAATIVESMQQISSVVHSTSATSEEIAAASEEFSSQAQILTEVTRKFEL